MEEEGEEEEEEEEDEDENDFCDLFLGMQEGVTAVSPHTGTEYNWKELLWLCFPPFFQTS